MQFSIQDISRITSGTLGHSNASQQSIQFFCTDSRKVRRPHSSIFVALLTKARDGHKFIKLAYDQGIRCFLVSNNSHNINDYEDATFIQVHDTLDAMQLIAAAHRRSFDIPVVGITGSNGKTIVKEWLAILLSHQEDVVKNPRSYNSQLGVPLSVSAIESHHSLGIFEAGISKPNEMFNLEKIIQPSIGLFTTIGAAHDVNFNSTQEKIREKLNLFINCKKLFYCRDHIQIHNEVSDYLLKQNTDILLRSWGENDGATLRMSEVVKSNTETRIKAHFSNELLEMRIPYTDSAYIENALHCWLVLLDLGYKNHEIAPWFRQLPPVQMRLELLKGINDCTLINDAYSSDLASLRIALDFLYEQKQHKRHCLILSDILQHSKGEKLYVAVVEILKQRPLHKLVLIGDDLGKNLSLFEQVADHLIHFKSVKYFLNEFDVQQFQNDAILIKGARQYMLERIVNRLEENIHRTVMSINLTALINNVNAYKKRLKPSTKIMAMVKAFSYGSGSYEIAHTLEHYGIDYLAVAYVDEGILLRKKGLQLPILILNPEVSSLDAMLHYQLEPEVYSLELLKQFGQRLHDADGKLNIHIKLDTGMHRLGVEEKDLDLFLEYLLSKSNFAVKSVFSHLVGSDEEKFLAFTKEQKERFSKMSLQIEKALGYEIIKHIANSSGALHNEELQFDMVRLGLGLYGITNNTSMQKELQQISTLKTHVSQVKILSKDETVGYSRAGTLDRDSIIATLNVGYADGYSRNFSMGNGKVLIKGTLAPVVGNVCMDMIMVDVTGIPWVKEGDEVIIFGEELSVTELATWINTIPYDIIAGISRRVKRVFYRE